MKNRERRLVDQRAVWLLFGLCWVVYFSAYLAKRNFSAAMTQMIGSGFLAKDRAGLINTVFFICYAAGQLCNGLLGDKLKPQRLILIGTISAGACIKLRSGSTWTRPCGECWLWQG